MPDYVYYVMLTRFIFLVPSEYLGQLLDISADTYIKVLVEASACLFALVQSVGAKDCISVQG